MVELTGTLIVETSHAVLIDFGLSESVWVPKSCLLDEDGDEVVRTDRHEGWTGEWYVREWFAHRNGLI